MSKTKTKAKAETANAKAAKQHADYHAGRQSLMQALSIAREPSRELDHTIQYYLNHLTAESAANSRFNTRDLWVGMATKEGWNTGRFTESLDEATSLLARIDVHGYTLDVIKAPGFKPFTKRCVANIKRPVTGKPGQYTTSTAYGATAALALVLAILRARGWSRKSKFRPLDD